MPASSPIEPAPPTAPSLPRLGSAVPLLRDPVAFLARCRERLGDTFRVRFFGHEVLFVFSPEGVRSLWAAPEAELSKGFADYEMIRAKVPDELFAGRRTRPHDLFSRDDVAEYRKNVEAAVAAELEGLGERGEFELFALTRRVGHRMGLASWGGLTGRAARHLDAVIAALDQLDTSDAFVHPIATLAAAWTGKRGARRALHALDERYRAILADRDLDPPDAPDLFDRIREAWSDTGSPERETGIALDALLVHMGSMSNLYAANAWTVIHLLERPDLAAAVCDGDEALLERCTHEAIRLHQRSIVLRRATRATTLRDETTTWHISAGGFAATMMPNTNTSALAGLDTFDPDHYAGARFRRAGELPARELVTTFGHGAHACPAMRFSIDAIGTFVGALLRRFELEPRYARPGPLRNQIGGIERADRPCRIRYVRRGD